MVAKRFFLLIILLAVLIGCRTSGVAYHREKIIKKFRHYRIYLNNRDLINLDTFYLDKDNVDKVIANNQTYRLNIFQKNRNSKFHLLNEVIKSSKYDLKNSDSLISVVDGVLIENLKQKSLRFEQNAVKEIITLKKEDVWKHFPHASSGMILITTKH